MKKLLFILTTAIALNVNAQTSQTIKINDFEYHCDSCTVDQAIEQAKETYYEALADINANKAYWENHQINDSSQNPFKEENIQSTKTSQITETTDPTKHETHVKINRYLVSAPNTNNIQSEENCNITLSVMVTPDGNIIGKPVCVRGSSTTNNTILINQVSEAVRTQTKFNKVETTENTREIITIRIVAN